MNDFIFDNEPIDLNVYNELIKMDEKSDLVHKQRNLERSDLLQKNYNQFDLEKEDSDLNFDY